MRKRPLSLLLSQALTIMGMILALWSGFAMAAGDGKDILGDAPALLKAITVSPDAYQVEIVADKALTYTFYKTANPNRAVIDLAQADAVGVVQNQEVNSGAIKRINITRHTFGGGFLSRIEIVLATEDEFTVSADPSDKSRLVVVFAKPALTSQALQAVETQGTSTVPVTTAVPVPVETAKAVVDAPQTELSEAPKDAQKKVVPQQEVAAVTPPLAVSAPETALPTQTPPHNTEPAKSDLVQIETLKKISAIEVGKDGVEIKVTGGADSFKSFTMTKPGRLVVDIFGVSYHLRDQSIELNSFGISKVRVGVTPEKVRLVFDSTKDLLPAYKVEKSGAGLTVTFASEASEPELKNAVSNELPSEPPKKAISAKVPCTLESIDFDVKGELSFISIKVSGACLPAKPVKVAKGVMLTFRNCQLPRRLQRTLDTSSFPSVVEKVIPYPVKNKRGNDARLLVHLRADAPTSLKQDGDLIVWEIRNTEIPKEKPETTMPELVSSRGKSAEFKNESIHDEIATETGLEVMSDDKNVSFSPKLSEKKKYSGRKVSLEFSDADIRKIFQLIAEVSNLNFLIADDVKGTISIKLVNVPWDQALDVILDSHQLEMKRDGNIVQIKPKGKFKSIEQEDADAKKARERTMPLITEIFEVNFASVGDVEKQFTSLKSERGNITRDERTNRVIVKDVQTAIDEMKFILKNIDMPERQVLIEARIVEATTSFTRDLGVQWGLHYRDSSASVANVNSLDTGWGGVIGLPPSSSGFNAANKAGASAGISFGTLTSSVQLDLRLSAAASAGMVKIISSPKVVTLNNKQAKISQGQAIYLPTTSAEGTKQDKIEATLSLEVKPHITPDGSIVMTITAKNDAPGTAPAGASAAVNKKEANTELLVKNGETTVIGGIYVDSDTDSDSGVPYLMDIPLLGWLFKSNSKVKTKTELLIFITPRIIS